MTGTEIIHNNRNRYIVLVNDKDILIHSNGRPFITDSLPEAKNLACEVGGRWIELAEFVRKYGN